MELNEMKVFLNKLEFGDELSILVKQGISTKMLVGEYINLTDNILFFYSATDDEILKISLNDITYCE